MDALELTGAGVAYQRKFRGRIHMNAVYRAGLDTGTTPVAFLCIQPDPVFPFQRFMGARADAFMVFARQAYEDVGL